MRLTTRLRSIVMRAMASERLLTMRQRRARRRREASGQPPTVLYFHQADDPYSFIMAQQLQRFARGIRVPIKAHLVSAPKDAYKGDAQRFDAWALTDAADIAPYLGEALPIPQGHQAPSLPAPDQVQAANGLLADKLGQDDFFHHAHQIGLALWGHEHQTISQSDLMRGETTVQAGTQLRDSLGHFLGGTLYFDGEWFWGADRLARLWERLQAEGYGLADTEPFDPFAAASLQRLTMDQPVDQNINLEYFPSLRSPYTAIAHAAVVDLVRRGNVAVQPRPVMPMLMRGVTAPRAKQQYIISDCAREARSKGVAFGNFVDPFGEPVRRGFQLFPAALAQGKAMEFIGAYLSAAFAQGIDIDSQRGLAQVVNNAGLTWEATVDHPDNAAWTQVLDNNIETMLDAGLWGVPSFRISSPGEPDFCCWGQDRLWRVEDEIARRHARTS